MRKIPLLLTVSLALAAPTLAGQTELVDKTTFHGNAAREGWNRAETVLTPETVASGAFGQIWQSPVFDSAGAAPPRLFASPLYLASVMQRSSPLTGQSVPVAYAVASTGFAYAVLAADRGGLSAGSILWRKRLTETPCQNGEMGSISTPVIDKVAGRIYVTS
ncbi:MAG: hypothetical protein VW891_03390, partial [Novosphingobium sp.]